MVVRKNEQDVRLIRRNHRCGQTGYKAEFEEKLHGVFINRLDDKRPVQFY